MFQNDNKVYCVAWKVTAYLYDNLLTYYLSVCCVYPNEGQNEGRLNVARVFFNNSWRGYYDLAIDNFALKCHNGDSLFHTAWYNVNFAFHGQNDKIYIFSLMIWSWWCESSTSNSLIYIFITTEGRWGKSNHTVIKSGKNTFAKTRNNLPRQRKTSKMNVREIRRSG